jgi:hypothetical protein
MGTHFHLIVETPTGGLSRGMQALESRYVRRVHGRRGTFGPVFQGRFKAKLIGDARQLYNTVTYVARNPVTEGWCEQPGDWAWSSHRATASGIDDGLVATSRLIDLLGYRGDDGPGQYRRLTGDTATEIPRPVPVPEPADLRALVPNGDPREIAVACIFHGYSLREIAKQLGVSASTVSRRYEDGRAMLQSEIDLLKGA